MKATKFFTSAAVTAAIAIAPFAPASAHDGWHRGHGGPGLGIFALGAAAVVGTAAILSLPFQAVAAAVPEPAPAPYYPPQAAYYPPQQQYAPPQAYYAPQPVYYAPAPAYYYGAPRVVYYR